MCDDVIDYFVLNAVHVVDFVCDFYDVAADGFDFAMIVSFVDAENFDLNFLVDQHVASAAESGLGAEAAYVSN